MKTGNRKQENHPKNSTTVGSHVISEQDTNGIYQRVELNQSSSTINTNKQHEVLAQVNVKVLQHNRNCTGEVNNIPMQIPVISMGPN